MTDTRNIEVGTTSGWGIFWAVVFACMFMTGNCVMCGGDFDYVNKYIGSQGQK